MTLSEILKSISPDDVEKTECMKAYDMISNYIYDKFERECILVGSVAKDTFLKDDKDLDIFIFFNIGTPRNKLESESLKIGKDVFNHFKSKYIIEYSEHPYISGTIDEFAVELVPCYKIDDPKDMKSAVDRTPFHLTYVLNNLKDGQNGQVRLLKKFLKTQKLYGAEAKTNGFSGYLCELLIIKYKSFLNLISEASNWPINTKIFFGKAEKSFKDPLIVIDPVDPKRNVASPVSLDTLSRFVLSCKEYHETEDIRMFNDPKKGYERVQDGMLITLVVDADILEDIFFAQCRRLLKTITRTSKREGFSIFRSGVFSKGIFLDFEVFELPKYHKHKGPAIGNKENMDKFMEKNERVFCESGHLFSIKKRKYNDVIDVINDILNSQDGMGNNIKKSKIRVLTENKAYNELKKHIIYF